MYVHSAIAPLMTSCKTLPYINYNRMCLAGQSNTGEKSILQVPACFLMNKYTKILRKFLYLILDPKIGLGEKMSSIYFRSSPFEGPTIEEKIQFVCRFQVLYRAIGIFWQENCKDESISTPYSFEEVDDSTKDKLHERCHVSSSMHASSSWMSPQHLHSKTLWFSYFNPLLVA